MLSDRPTKLVPPVLAKMAAWSLCLILTGVVVFYFVQVIARLSFVVLPVAIALLLTALLYPMTRSLRQAGMRPIYATWLTMIAALAVLARAPAGSSGPAPPTSSPTWSSRSRPRWATCRNGS
ncbi:hypothetical protein ACFSTC_14850 [Nonomuraea ferruginea]